MPEDNNGRLPRVHALQITQNFRMYLIMYSREATPKVAGGKSPICKFKLKRMKVISSVHWSIRRHWHIWIQPYKVYVLLFSFRLNLIYAKCIKNLVVYTYKNSSIKLVLQQPIKKTVHAIMKHATMKIVHQITGTRHTGLCKGNSLEEVQNLQALPCGQVQVCTCPWTGSGQKSIVEKSSSWDRQSSLHIIVT